MTFDPASCAQLNRIRKALPLAEFGCVNASLNSGWQVNYIALPGESGYKPTMGLYLQTAGRFARGKCMKSTKRKNMLPEERRAQLLGCAQMLFFSKGFEDTTIQDVLDMASVSKGGFYHHFKSKDELLFGVLDEMVEGVFSQMAVVASDETSSALDLLHSFIHLRANYLREHDYPGQVEFFRVMNQDKNMVLLEQFKRRVRTGAMPVLTGIIQKGCDEGTFTVADVDTAAELILFLSTFIDLALLRAIDARGSDTADHAADKLQAAIDMQFLTLDRVLGLPDGTTNFGWPEAVDVTMATVPATPPSAN